MLCSARENYSALLTLSFLTLVLSRGCHIVGKCRLSLADGLFMAPLQSRSPAVNACGVAPAHGLVGCAGEDGWLECFDLRQRRSVGAMNAAAAMDAVRFSSPHCKPARTCVSLECVLCDHLCMDVQGMTTLQA